MEVSPERLAGWVERFSAAHGGCAAAVEAAAVEDAVVRLSATDGAVAVLEVPRPPLPPPGEEGPVAALARHAGASCTALLLLVRRGGAAVGLARDGALLDHASASRYVQSRTAAGGWSQQRYARRRSGQAGELATAAADAAVRVLHRAPGAPQLLVPGGDRPLLAAVLEDPRLRSAAALPRAPLMDVREPRLQVLAEAAQRCRAVRVRVSDAPG
ncbi:acVLRF1 family peptidyl-tRNA hydrolase [Quadrisphaera sp. DSM 44207]|uniref:acVLRF1 family peptidyl-tRNA hydrolase n=1 Tax=Quadrisphaera sp. DSM 44207 TaxID=1881057 RepID=UPI00088593D7|nr:acVLRF1 family peptidyl-tRNA hydrolase [Quadrisphaera sp. DSM 44207]SDQ43781.1 hypothetical protein SAMN05428996_1700 [Quadrisphaera sp. DSM 44207]